MKVSEIFRRAKAGPQLEENIAEIKPEWSRIARELLARRDRFTSAAIIKDFKTNLYSADLTVDLGTCRATSVADNQQVVIWRIDGGKVLVDGVVAASLEGADANKLKSDLESTLAFETKGIPLNQR